jgi:hypothetical protein
MSGQSELRKSILHVLDFDGGYVVKDISERMSHPYCSYSNRQRSAGIRHTLNHMRDEGLVAHLDDQKPTAWVITHKGAEAIGQ